MSRSGSCAGFVVTLAMMVACAQTSHVPPQPPSAPRLGGFVVSGRMAFAAIETGCWYLATDDGKKYELAGEDLSILEIDGLVVEVEVRPLEGVSSLCQIGTVVEVLNIIRMER